MPNKFDLNKAGRHFKQAIQYLPSMLGNDALNFFLDSWKRQGWLDHRAEPWRRRSVNNKKNKGRAILVDSGRLRRSNKVISVTGGMVKIGTDVPYAKAHNEGFRGVVNVKAHTRNRYSKAKEGTGKFTKKGKERMKTVSRISGAGDVKAHTRKVNIVKRQFMGSSAYLTKALQRRLQAELMKGLR